MRLLDLFCGAGGAGMGYSRAGFEVVGVDHKSQPRYPFEFWRSDALTYLRELILNKDSGGLAWEKEPFVAVHASPPCQDYSVLRHLANPSPRLIDPVRELLVQTGLPWIIENVETAPLPRQDTLDGRYGVELCGTMFGLVVYRHRLFETSFPVTAPRSCAHLRPALNPYNKRARKRDGIEKDATQHHAKGMDIDWMRGDEIGEAIPPAYTELIGHQLMQHLEARVAV